MSRFSGWWPAVVLLALAGTLSLSGCAGNSEVRIGCVSPFSGDGAVYGQALKRGFDLYIDELMSTDSAFAKKLKIIYEDDKLDAKEGTNAVNKLINVDKVQVIIGAFTSNVTLAIAPICEQKKVVLLSPTATNYKIKDAGDYIFRACPSDAYQGQVMADFALNVLKKKTACVLYMNTDYGVGLKEVFVTRFTAGGGKVLGVEGFDMGATDMRAQLQKVKSDKPGLVFLPSNYVEAANVVKQSKELGVNVPFLCTDGVFEQNFLGLTKGISEGIYVSTMAWGTKEYKDQAEQFRARYRVKYHEEPGVYSALCHDALAVVVSALRTAKYSGTAIKDQLYRTEYTGATGLTKFDSYGEVEKGFDVYQVKNNQFVRLD